MAGREGSGLLGGAPVRRRGADAEAAGMGGAVSLAAPGGFARADALAAIGLLVAVVAIMLTAPRHGEFWWSDAPRHALNGVFLADLLKDLPFGDPQRWAVDYYLQYPALTILFYPPLFPAAEALTFLMFGPSHAAAVGTVAAFYAALALGAYALGRRWLSPAEAFAAALLLCGSAEVAFWGRQVMTEIPAFAFLVWSAYCLDRFLAERRPGFLYAALGLLLLGAYIKLTVVFALPAYGLAILAERRWAAFRDRHIWLAGAALVLPMAPLAFLTLKFGQANIQSVSGIPDAQVSRGSLAGWVFYLRRLPHQIGWVPLFLAAAYAVALVLRRPGGLPRRALVLTGAWLAFGYVFFSAIDLKEDRHTVFLLYPVALFAVLGVTRWVPVPRLGTAAALALAAGTLAWTFAFAPAPRISGYADAARWIVENTPPGRVLFSGKRDGSFIFNLRAVDRERRYTVVRADKLLLNIAVRREIGVTEKNVAPEELAAMFHDYAIPYVVAQRDFWTDLKSMRDLQALLDSERFEEVARIAVTANWPHDDRELRIYRLRGPVATSPLPLKMELPIINRTLAAEPAR